MTVTNLWKTIKTIDGVKVPQIPIIEFLDKLAYGMIEQATREQLQE